VDIWLLFLVTASLTVCCCRCRCRCRCLCHQNRHGFEGGENSRNCFTEFGALLCRRGLHRKDNNWKTSRRNSNKIWNFLSFLTLKYHHIPFIPLADPLLSRFLPACIKTQPCIHSNCMTWWMDASTESLLKEYSSFFYLSTNSRHISSPRIFRHERFHNTTKLSWFYNMYPMLILLTVSICSSLDACEHVEQCSRHVTRLPVTKLYDLCFEPIFIKKTDTSHRGNDSTTTTTKGFVRFS